MIAGTLQFDAKYDAEGQVVGWAMAMDDNTRHELLAGNDDVAEAFAKYIIKNQEVLDALPTDHESFIQKFNITRQRLADDADGIINQIADTLLPATETLFDKIMLADHTLRVELVRTFAKGYVDSIGRIFTSGDVIQNDWQEMQQAWEDGNLSEAGKKLLSVGGNVMIEGLRLVDLLPVVGLVTGEVSKGLKATAIFGDDVVGMVKGLLKGSGDDAASSLSNIFKNSANKAQILDNAYNIDDINKMLHRGYATVDELSDLPFAESKELELLLREGQNKFWATGRKTTILGHYDPDIKTLLSGTDAKKIGLDILNLPDGTWSWGQNVEFLDDAINNGRDILLVTEKPRMILNPVTKELTNSTYMDEIEYLLSHGYKKVGNYMIKS